MLARLLLIGAILCCMSIPVVGQDDLYVPKMSFNNNYINAFGDPDMVVWRGNVPEDGSTVSGRLEGSWQNGCTLIMQRR